MEVLRITKDNYRETIKLMNKVCNTDMFAIMPKLNNDSYAGKHLAVKEDGKLVAALGVYPLPSTVAGHKIILGTMGNVVTDPDYRGRGYMSALLDATEKDLKEASVDAVRLNGKADRYRRYGYEACATMVDYLFDNFTDTSYELMKITADKTEIIKKCMALHKKDNYVVNRDTAEDFYNTVCAWESNPYAVLDNGKFIGYLSLNGAYTKLNEIYMADNDNLLKAISAAAKLSKNELTVSMPLFRYPETDILKANAKTVTYFSPSQFYIRNFKNMIEAFLDLKLTYTDIKDQSFVIDITDDKKYKVGVKNGKAFCIETDSEADITLDRIAATSYLFKTATGEEKKNEILPLPLTWMMLDRV